MTERVLEFIIEFRNEHGVSPTVREVMRGVGLASTSVAAYHLSVLEEQGRLRRAMPGSASRSLIPVEVGNAA